MVDAFFLSRLLSIRFAFLLYGIRLTDLQFIGRMNPWRLSFQFNSAQPFLAFGNAAQRNINGCKQTTEYDPYGLLFVPLLNKL